MNIGILLVTYNRKDYLEKALHFYEQQTKKPKFILVVNNNSNDGTLKLLEEWKSNNKSFMKYVINLNENIGGSGGFHVGLKKCMELESDWIWVADDDAFPEIDALQKIGEFYKKVDNKNKSKIAALCGTVINNSKIDISHRRRLKLNTFTVEEIPVLEEEYVKESFEIDLFSYVGTVISKDYLNKVGITEKEYFIYYDDTEHAIRLSKEGRILCLPNVRIQHDTDLQNRDILNWKLYYGLRNKLFVYKKHFSKKYYLYLFIKLKLRLIISSNQEYKNLLRSVLIDVKNNVQGLHYKYKPGWKCN